jgi:hypothetical protein
MKKIISGFLAIIMMFSIGTVAFASQTSTSASKVESSIDIKPKIGELVATRQTIHDNEIQLNINQKDVRAALIAVRQKIAALKKNETALTQAQIDSLKAALSSIKDARKALIANHKGKIASIYQDLNKAKEKVIKEKLIKNRDYTEIKASFDAILAEQASRKADLQRILDSINSINI